MTKRQKLVTREMIESDPAYQETKQIQREILEEYDYDYERYLDDLMAEPDEPGVNYGDEPSTPAWLNWVVEKLNKLILDEKVLKVLEDGKAEQEAFDKKKARRELARQELAQKGLSHKELAIGK